MPVLPSFCTTVGWPMQAGAVPPFKYVKRTCCTIWMRENGWVLSDSGCSARCELSPAPLGTRRDKILRAATRTSLADEVIE
jgi:hypothetical protein